VGVETKVYLVVLDEEGLRKHVGFARVQGIVVLEIHAVSLQLSARCGAWAMALRAAGRLSAVGVGTQQEHGRGIYHAVRLRGLKKV
jgi:hypothetical protein